MLPILAWLLVVGVTALKRSNIGKNEWALQNVGELTSVAMEGNEIKFYSERGIYGAIDVKNGQLKSKTQLEPGYKFLGELAHNAEAEWKFAAGGLQQVIYHRDGSWRKLLRETSLPSEPIVHWVWQHPQGYLATANTFGVVSQDAYKELLLGQIVAVTRITSSPKGVRVFYMDNGTLTSQDAAVDVLTNKHTYDTLEPLKVVTTEKYTLMCYNDHLNVYDSERQLLKKIEGHYKNSFNYSNAVLVEVSSSEYLVRLDDMSKVAVAPGSIHLENHKRHLLTIETIDDDINSVGYRVASENFRSVWWSAPSNNPILRVWIYERTDIDMQVLVQYEDLQLAYYELRSKDRRVEPRWVREEGMAYLTDTLFLQLQNEKEFSNPYYEELLAGHLHRNWNPAHIINHLRLRVQSQLMDLVLGGKEMLANIVNMLTQIQLGNLFTKEPVLKYEASNAEETTFALRKTLLCATRQNWLLNVDSKSGKILWKSKLPGQASDHIGLFRLVADELQRVLLVQYSNSELSVLEVNRTQGDYQLLKNYQLPHRPQVHQINDNTLQILTHNSSLFFELHDEIGSQRKELLFYRLDGNRLLGESVQQGQRKLLWQLDLPSSEEVVGVQSSFGGQQSFKLPLFDEKKVYFKNIDFSNFAVLTRSNNTNLNLYVVNGATGHILFNKYRRNVDFSNWINLAYDENTVVVSYFSRMNKLFELWVIEQYQHKTETSAMDIIDKYYYSQAQVTPVTLRPAILIEEQIFGFPLTIKHLRISSSKLALLKRNLVVITRDDQVYSIDRKLVSARRPSGEAVFESDKLPKYEYLLPLVPLHFLSYNLRLFDLRKLQFSPTKLESNLFLLAYGTDVFMLRWTPEQTFDQITEDFNYLFLLAVVVGITFALYYVHKITLKSKERRHFIN